VFRFLTLFLLLPLQSFSMPKNFEIWFLSPDKSQGLIDILNKKHKASRYIAQSYLQCQPMGDYCFDPQVGLYKKEDTQKVQNEPNYSLFDEQEDYKSLPTAKSVDRDLITCEKGNFFDLFCGKSKATPVADIKVEIWTDISSTMKQVDWPGLGNEKCFRERFVRLVEDQCPLNNKLAVKVFDETIKPVDTMSRVCTNYGLNNIKWLTEAIENSTAPHLIIITDIFESYNTDINGNSIMDFAQKHGVRSTIRGLETPLYAKDILKDVSQIHKLCK
jgi:hypothetical protein